MTPGVRSERARAPVVLWGLLAALFAFVAVFRFLALKNGFPNDHFLHLAGAQQILLGGWPTRDFQDPGLPLMYVLSAGAELLLGRTLFAEAVFIAVAFGVAAVLTGLAVYELTRSTTLAVIAVVLEVAIFPRTYGYPKVLVYAAGFLLLQRYVSRPDTKRLVALAAVAAVAFLFRHDHGIYLTIGGVLAAGLAPLGDGWRARLCRAGTMLIVTGLLLAPYVLYVQVHEGVGLYLQTGMEFSAREAGRQWHVWPSLADAVRSREATLVYVFHALPVLALLALAARLRDPAAWTPVARVVPVAAVAVLVNVSFIRDPLNTRLPDAIVPAVTLVAWLTSNAWTTPARSRTRAAVVAFLVLFAYSVASVGRVTEELDRAGLLVSWTRTPGYMRELAVALRTPLAPSQIPSSAAGHLLPFLEYVRRCTAPDDRLLVTGFLPEVPVLTGRAFAGGQSTFIPGYFALEENQRLVLARLRDESVPFALVPNDYAGEIDQGFPLLTAYLRTRYVPLATLGAESDAGVQVLVDSTRRWPSRDEATGWPCRK